MLDKTLEYVRTPHVQHTANEWQTTEQDVYKRQIKKQYAKTLKAGGKAKKTAEATAKAAKKTAQETKRATFFVVRHWKGCLIVGGIAFIVLLLFGGLSSCSLFGGNSGSGLIASSYLSEDAYITGAESAYAAMEAELQDNAVFLHLLLGLPIILIQFAFPVV